MISATIADALESVRKQTYKGSIEIIVVNDGSTDDSVCVVNQYKNEHKELDIKVIEKCNGGAASARNAGIKAAVDDGFIAFLDADDEWKEHKLDTIMPYFQNKHIDCLGSANEKPLRVGFRSIKTLTKIKPTDLVFRMAPQPSTVVFRKNILEKIGYFNEMRYGEDIDYWLRIAYQAEFYVIPDTLGVYGKGKRGYGVSGMTAKLKEMHRGEIEAIDNIYSIKGINPFIYHVSKLFMRIKYMRRKFVVFIEK
jgi:glycosyltransferase involved in cell wall biosynthesis